MIIFFVISTFRSRVVNEASMPMVVMLMIDDDDDDACRLGRRTVVDVVSIPYIADLLPAGLPLSRCAVCWFSYCHASHVR